MTRFVAITAVRDHTWLMRSVLTLLLLAVLAVLPGRANAFDLEENMKLAHAQYQGEAVLQATQGNGMSLSQATESVRRRTGGRVVGAETKIEGGREVHYIKVLKDGKVKTHKVNGRSRR
ncbi:MAG: hypothetical protein K0U72_09655 [Gammaproteobacteria bacterium]|nr:hypothetical protein [Gammaproteobacteria bacterium]